MGELPACSFKYFQPHNTTQDDHEVLGACDHLGYTCQLHPPASLRHGDLQVKLRQSIQLNLMILHKGSAEISLEQVPQLSAALLWTALMLPATESVLSMTASLADKAGATAPGRSTKLKHHLFCCFVFVL